MSGNRRGLVRAAIALAVAGVLTVAAPAGAAHAEASAQATPYEPLPGVLGPPEGSYTDQQVLVPASFIPGAASKYRFSGQESWLAFDRPLYLSAFPGEERRYIIEFSMPGGGGAFLAYTIDMRPPEPPAFRVPQGVVETSLAIALDSADTVYVSVDGSGFEMLPASGSIVVTADQGAVRNVSASAYAVDAVGNVSRYVSARWRLYPTGFAPQNAVSPPASTSETIIPAASSTELGIELTELVGSVKLALRSPEGSIPCVAVNAPDPFNSQAVYAELSGSSPASFHLSFPWGYDRETQIHYGFIKDGVRHIVREPLRFVPRFPAEDAPGIPVSPVPPIVRIEDRVAYLQWPANPWTIMLSLGEGEFKPCSGALRLELGTSPIGFRYYAIDRSGTRSAIAGGELPARYIPPVPRLVGVENGATYGSALLVLPDGDYRLRYELTRGQVLPPAISGQSAQLGKDGLRLEGEAGRVVRYRMRVIAEDPAAPAGPARDWPSERFYDFSIDREPPPVPELAQLLRSFSSSDTSLVFKPLGGTIFVSISEDGGDRFEKYEGPMAIHGSEEGRRRYTIRAYAEDEYGNRSAPMQALQILIDRSSLYVDPAGRAGASGSPDDPIQYLDEAVELAQRQGKRFINIRGSVSIRKPIVINGHISLVGGFDSDWNESRSMAGISATLPATQESFVFTVDGGALSLSGLNVNLAVKGSGGLILARSAAISLARTSVTMSGGTEALFVRSSDAIVKIESSSLSMASCVTARAIMASGGSLELKDSAIQCDASVRLFDAIRLQGTKSRVSGLKVDACPSQALSLLYAANAGVRVDGAALKLSGGGSSCRVFSAIAAELTVSSVYIDAAWQGSFEGFNARSGSKLRVAHVTAVVEATMPTFAALDASSAELVNNIALFTGNAPVFVRSDAAPRHGTISANCLWGFAYYLEGGASAQTVLELNRISGAARANISEAPTRTLSPPVKGYRRLSAKSACVDGGVVVEWASAFDFLGTPRASITSGLPDIGAEEL